MRPGVRDGAGQCAEAGRTRCQTFAFPGFARWSGVRVGAWRAGPSVSGSAARATVPSGSGGRVREAGLDARGCRAEGPGVVRGPGALRGGRTLRMRRAVRGDGAERERTGGVHAETGSRGGVERLRRSHGSEGDRRARG